ncbi:MAG: BTAD domain-containing putative transcriptional regulator [Actinomycetota bacterium]|nr:BTAD domain-containing putative transcriptional regulator [Actinomycetota bacterium]
MSARWMARPARLAKGLGALALLASLVGGIPWALWHYVGWPLPHHVPSTGQIGHVLTEHGIAGRSLVDVLAVVVWITWAVLVASVAAEIPAALAGRRARRLPVAGVFQPLTGRLVAAVAVACLALAPRPAHDTTTAPAALGLAAVRRPVAALVLSSDRQPLSYRAPPTSPPGANTAETGTAPPGTPAPGPVAGATRAYVVRRGDTLWGIAERELGDPLRWSQIYALNVGRPQPGGVTLTDPHWIDPGWTLLLPTPAGTAPATARSSPPSSSPAPPPGQAPPGPGATPTTTLPPTATSPTTAVPPPAGPPARPVPTSTVPDRTGHRRAPAPVNGTSLHPADRGLDPVRLPSGSVVAGSFAAGVLSAVALGRLRRRHAYRYHPPEPGRDFGPPPLRPVLRHLARVAAAHDEDDAAALAGTGGDGTAGTDATGIDARGTAGADSALDHAEGRQHPGYLEVGTRGGQAVSIEFTDLSGVAICGPAADDIARALLAGLVVRAGPGAAEILCATETAERLLPGTGIGTGIGTDPAVRLVATPLEVARVVEADRIARTRRLDAVGARDAASFREEHPENPLPLLLVVADAPPGESAGRWTALCAGAARLGIAVVFLGDTPAATGRLATDLARTVTDAAPPRLAAVFAGAELFGLGAEEAVELLGSVFDASNLDAINIGANRADGRDCDEPGQAEALTRVIPLDNTDEAPLPTPEAAVPWPELASAAEAAVRPLRVEILGPPRITVSGMAVANGLRSRAKMLLAWYLCRPEGATAEQAVDTLWPDTAPDGVLKQFWRSLGDLRAGLRGSDGGTPEVLEKTGVHYRAKHEEISCDLWDFQAALADAARSRDDETARQALRRAVEVYRGDLLDGAEDPWVEPVRQDLHRRALDAHLRLAELDEHAGHSDAAIDTLERAVELDRYAEEPYRRLMVLHAEHGRPDAVTATWKLLHRRLAEIDLDIEAATVNLYRTLAATGPSDAPRPIRLRS